MAVIGFDIDGTLAGSDWLGCETVAAPVPKLTQLVHDLFGEGHTLCVWSCRADRVVERWLQQYKLRRYFKYINESPYPSDSAKASFDLLIDDRVLRTTENLTTTRVLSEIRRLGVVGTDRDNDFSDRNLRPYYQGAGLMFINHFDGLWQALWEGRETDKRTAFLTICSHAKPYSKSYIHSTIRKRLYQEGLIDDLDYIHISGAGIIPQDCEMVYPFNAYDGDSSTYPPEVLAHHRRKIADRVEEWLQEHVDRYDNAVIYLREGGNTHDMVKQVLKEGIYPTTHLVGGTMDEYPKHPAVVDVDDCLTTSANLDKLVTRIKDIRNV